MEQLDREHIASLIRERVIAARDDFDVTRFANQHEAIGYYTGRLEEYCAQNAIDQSEVLALEAVLSYPPALGKEAQLRWRAIIEFQCHDADEVAMLERLVRLVMIGYTDVRVERFERVER